MINGTNLTKVQGKQLCSHKKYAAIRNMLMKSETLIENDTLTGSVIA